MKRLAHKSLVLLTIGVMAGAAVSVGAAPVTVSVKTSEPGREISPLMAGLSYEITQLLPKTNGIRYFRPDDKALVTLYKTVGVKSLRVGGGSVDTLRDPMPSEEDVVNFFDFAKAAGVKVIYSFRLCDGPPGSATKNAEEAAKVAKIVRDRYADVLDTFAMGNEPHYYAGEWQKYRPKWEAIWEAIIAVYPEARFSGPDECRGETELISGLAHEFGSVTGRLVEVSQHQYPFGGSYINNPWPKHPTIENLIPADTTKSREKMLSPAAYKTYEKVYKQFTDATKGTSVPFRMSECNSLSCSGLWGVSDSFAAALWSLDYLYWWASHGATGLNFHTGDRSGGGDGFIARYAAFRTNPEGGYMVFPLSYGMKMFDFGGHGKLLPTAVTAATNQNVVAYSTLSEGKTVFVTIINKMHGPEAKEQVVKVKLDQPLADSKANVIHLCGRNNEIGGNLTDVTLGGAPIKADGTWDGDWTELPASAISKDGITVKMRPASAVVVKVHAN